MLEPDLRYARLMAEILRLQRWAGGESVSAARIFGLMHGFETVLKEESEDRGVSAETQRLVEDLLEDVEAGKQSTDVAAIKHRLYRDGIGESEAGWVMRLCLLQSRFGDAIAKLSRDSGSFLLRGANRHSPESSWFGALHYMELVDTTGEPGKSHAFFSACVPRVGEVVEPERGSKMRVVGVEYVAAITGEAESSPMPILIPYVYLEPLEDDQE